MLVRLIEKFEDCDLEAAVVEAKAAQQGMVGKNNVIVPAEQVHFVLQWIIDKIEGSS